LLQTGDLGSALRAHSSEQRLQKQALSTYPNGAHLEPNKTARGNAGQYFVAGELSRRGYSAAITLGNTPNTDILCSNRDGTRFVHIQVKTYVPGTKSCSVGLKAAKSYDSSFFWVLAGVPPIGSELSLEFIVIPAREMSEQVAAYHSRWLGALGKGDRIRKDSSVRAVGSAEGSPSYFWNVRGYLNKWHWITDELDRR
jgi:hypothetical protein